jgi:hypothetical protein
VKDLRTEKSVAMLFASFTVIYGHKWTSNLPTGDKDMMSLAMHHWSDALSGLTEEDVERGIARASGSLRWPPSICEFVELALEITPLDEILTCYSSGRGFGDLGEVGAEVIRLADTFNLYRMSTQDGRKYLTDLYGTAVSNVRARLLEERESAAEKLSNDNVRSITNG